VSWTKDPIGWTASWTENPFSVLTQWESCPMSRSNGECYRTHRKGFLWDV